MTTKRFDYLTDDDMKAMLVGQRVVEASMDDATLVLGNGTRITFDRDNSDCCSYIDLKALHATDNIITAAELRDNEDETQGEGEYKAWVHVVTEAGELRVAEADGNASNGYYLHGFALGATVTIPEQAGEARKALGMPEENGEQQS